ncbi:MAG: DUF4231 domain-containing protein [Cyclobacteriaceae bacterium]
MQLKQEDYLTERLDDQLKWYSRKSASNHKMYKRMQVSTIMAAATIPFLAAYASEERFYINILIGVMGMVVAFITAIISLNKYQENWIAYRNMSEALKQEKYRYLTTTEPYHEADAFNLLVQRVEGLISKENTQWSQSMKKENKHLTERVGEN